MTYFASTVGSSPLRCSLALAALGLGSFACTPDRADVFLDISDSGTVALACERSGTIPDVPSDLLITRVDNLATSVCRGDVSMDDRRAVYAMRDAGPDEVTLKAHFTCTDGRRADVASERSALCDRLFEESDDPLVGLR